MRVPGLLMTTIAAALVFVGASCGPKPGPASPPPVQPMGGATASMFPPPPIEIDPGGGKLMWMIDSKTITVAHGDSSNRVADEFTWKVTGFDVTDANDKVQSDVNYVSLISDGKELAIIRRVGGQLHWTVLGDTPQICSRYDVTGWIPACGNGGATAGNRGIPAVLIDVPLATIKAEWKNEDGTIGTGEVKHVYIKPRTCPPY